MTRPAWCFPVRNFLSVLGKPLNGIARGQQKPSGFSLAETIIALGVLGVVLIPILFLSSATFMDLIIKEREKLMVAHAGSQVLNRMALELSQTRRILPNSDSTNLYFSYYDPIRSETVKRGYRLSSNGLGGQQLQRLTYDEASSSWVAKRPYGRDDSEDIVIPNAAVFDYCTESDCTVTPENALAVKLVDWEFQKNQFIRQSDGTVTHVGTDVGEQLKYQLILPTDVTFYIASGTVGEFFVSDTPRELFAYYVGSGADLSLMSLSPSSGNLNYPNFASVNSAGVTTVLVSTSSPTGVNSTQMDPASGRVYFGDSANYYTWFNGNLSTLVSARNQPGKNSSVLNPASGRVFFGEQGTGNFYSWQNGTLSTLKTSVANLYGITIDPNTGRVFYGEDTAGGSGKIWTWQSGSPTTILNSVKFDGVNMVTDPNTGRLFFTNQNTPGVVYTWLNGTLSTVLGSLTNPGYASSISVVPSTGRVYFGDSTNFYSWLGGTLSTIVSETYPGSYSTAVDPLTGRVYFGVSGAGSGNFYTWEDGVLSTILTGRPQSGMTDITVDPNNGRVYFGEHNATGNYYTWANGTLSTLLTSKPYPGAIGSTTIDPATGRIFFAERAATGNIYTWSNGTLSTLVSSAALVNGSNMTIDSTTGRAFFTDDTHVYSWLNGTLSTLASTQNYPGYGGSLQYHPSTQHLFWGENGGGTSRFVVWSPNTSQTGTLLRANSSGTPSAQYYNLEATSDTYIASAQDSQGDLYLVNDTQDSVDRFRYNNATGKYTRISRMGWSSWASAVKAITIDQASSGLTLLARNKNTSAWEIEVYADRTIDGTPASPTLLSLPGGSTTPTGLAVNGRTGDYLVVDSTLNGTNINLFVLDGTDGTLEQTIVIDVSATNLSTSAVTETNFKIGFNDQENILYLLAPTTGYIYGLALPQYF